MSEAGSERLGALRARVARWRRHHGGPGRRIPAWIWEEAGAIAAVLGVSETARALRLAQGHLAAVVDDMASADAPRSPGNSPFVELGVGDVEVFSGVTVEIEVPAGARIRIRGVSAEMVACVATSLLGSARP